MGGTEDHIRCQGLSSGQRHIRQTPYPLHYCSRPNGPVLSPVSPYIDAKTPYSVHSLEGCHDATLELFLVMAEQTRSIYDSNVFVDVSLEPSNSGVTLLSSPRAAGQAFTFPHQPAGRQTLQSRIQGALWLILLQSCTL